MIAEVVNDGKGSRAWRGLILCHHSIPPRGSNGASEDSSEYG
jgi:hypothetical protein